MFGFVFHWRSHLFVFLHQIGPNMGEKWSHNEALGTILTPEVPKTVQDSKKCWKSDLLDPPQVTHLGVNIARKGNLV